MAAGLTFYSISAVMSGAGTSPSPVEDVQAAEHGLHLDRRSGPPHGLAVLHAVCKKAPSR